MNIFAAALSSVLPKGYREKITLYAIPSAAGVLSGILEMLISLGILIARYFSFMNQRLASLPTVVMAKAAERSGESLVMALGGVFFVEYLLQFATMFLIFLALEGSVRAMVAFASGEILPSAPLKAVAVLHASLGAQVSEGRLGRRVRDEVAGMNAGQSLRIASCRPKAWNKLTTISYNGDLYELMNEGKGRAPRMFVYILQKKSLAGIVRGIHYYDPDETLKG